MKTPANLKVCLSVESNKGGQVSLAASPPRTSNHDPPVVPVFPSPTVGRGVRLWFLADVPAANTWAHEQAGPLRSSPDGGQVGIAQVRVVLEPRHPAAEELATPENAMSQGGQGWQKGRELEGDQQRLTS